MNLRNHVLFRLGNHIDTDVITPGKYLTGYEPKYLGSICLKDSYPEFRSAMRPGGILVAGINFGCGSSRETAPIALKAAGVQVILAEEFARIFYRNAINIGLPCMVCPGISAAAQIGDELEIDLLNGTVQNLTTNACLSGTPLPTELLAYFNAGGLMPFLKQQIAAGLSGGER